MSTLQQRQKRRCGCVAILGAQTNESEDVLQDGEVVKAWAEVGRGRNCASELLVQVLGCVALATWFLHKVMAASISSISLPTDDQLFLTIGVIVKCISFTPASFFVLLSHLPWEHRTKVQSQPSRATRPH